MDENKEAQLAALLLSVDAGAAMQAGAARRYMEVTITRALHGSRSVAERVAALRRRFGWAGSAAHAPPQETATE